MTAGTIRVDGRKFRVIPEEDYRVFQAAIRAQRLQERQDAADLAEARRRLRDPHRKTVPLSKLTAELGL